MHEEAAYTFIDTQESWATIYGVLRHLGVDARNPAFEDYAQEAWMIFYQWLQEPLAADLGPEGLRGVAYTRMYRRILNLLHREHRHRDRRNDDEVLTQQPASVDFETAWFAQLAYTKLTDRHRLMLHWLVEHGDTQAVVADKLHISRRTLQRELQQLRECLVQNGLVERPREA